MCMSKNITFTWQQVKSLLTTHFVFLVNLRMPTTSLLAMSQSHCWKPWMGCNPCPLQSHQHLSMRRSSFLGRWGIPLTWLDGSRTQIPHRWRAKVASHRMGKSVLWKYLLWKCSNNVFLFFHWNVSCFQVYTFSLIPNTGGGRWGEDVRALWCPASVCSAL